MNIANTIWLVRVPEQHHIANLGVAVEGEEFALREQP
jgi:hypothetical protein